jgi:hypothetical protein
MRTRVGIARRPLCDREARFLGQIQALQRTSRIRFVMTETASSMAMVAMM